MIPCSEQKTMLACLHSNQAFIDSPVLSIILAESLEEIRSSGTANPGPGAEAASEETNTTQCIYVTAQKSLPGSSTLSPLSAGANAESKVFMALLRPCVISG